MLHYSRPTRGRNVKRLLRASLLVLTAWLLRCSCTEDETVGRPGRRDAGFDSGVRLPTDASEGRDQLVHGDISAGGSAGSGGVGLLDASREGGSDTGTLDAHGRRDSADAADSAHSADSAAGRGRDGACGAGVEPAADGGLLATDSGGACRSSVSSTLPGVFFRFPPQRCQFSLAEAAAGISLQYELVVTQGVDVALNVLDEGCCQRTTILERLVGGGQSYCLCDFGLCDPCPLSYATRIPCGMTPLVFSWDGRNWNGPSDTMTPKGASFPPGEYTFTVSMMGQRSVSGIPVAFAVQATFRIDLVP
jgi:hypothetical protein